VLSEREYVGSANFDTLLTCESFVDPNTCREDLFWRSVYNTAFYVIFQVE